MAVKMYLNTEEFNVLQESLCLNNTQMARELNITRYTLIKAKKGKPIGIELLAGFMLRFPSAQIKKYFTPKVSRNIDNI